MEYPGQPEERQQRVVAEAGDGADAVVSHSKNHQTVGVRDRVTRLAQITAGRGLTVGARGHQTQRPLTPPGQSWESFSAPWHVDVRIAFEVGRAALARPLRPGSTVVILSSGAALGGSPLSGGYAGAKRTQMFLAGCLQRAADARGLGIRFVALVPGQLLTGTAIGEAAAAAYGAERGRPADTVLKEQFPVPLDPAGVARAILAIVSDEDHDKDTALVVTGKGVERA
ncbi:SDR family NAD(P)-dependent oxidoreductase [Streptomyces sp. NPDC048304]|uniref:SDR family NAD(P)-dependent oxidoreductase n=1 Tax=Streptomyces sp. NPDC048304 TaxID=3154820 RepID=UPI003407409D